MAWGNPPTTLPVTKITEQTRIDLTWGTTGVSCIHGYLFVISGQQGTAYSSHAIAQILDSSGHGITCK